MLFAALCTILDCNKVSPNGKILFVGTLNKQSLRFLGTLRESDVVFYATTEGVSRLDEFGLSVSARLGRNAALVVLGTSDHLWSPARVRYVQVCSNQGQVRPPHLSLAALEHDSQCRRLS